MDALSCIQPVGALPRVHAKGEAIVLEPSRGERGGQAVVLQPRGRAPVQAVTERAEDVNATVARYLGIKPGLLRQCAFRRWRNLCDELGVPKERRKPGALLADLLLTYEIVRRLVRTAQARAAADITHDIEAPMTRQLLRLAVEVGPKREQELREELRREALARLGRGLIRR